MGKWLRLYFNAGTLLFVGILIAGIAIMYLCAIALKAIRMILAEKKSSVLWLLDGLYSPLMFFIMLTAYSGGYSFVSVPVLGPEVLERTLGVLLLVDIGWAALNVGKRGLIAIFKVVSQNVVRIYTVLCLAAFGAAIIILYISCYPALIAGAVFSLIFVLLVNEITRITPEIKPRQDEASPRRLIMTHIYIATSETDEAVKRALQAIREAIETVDGTEKDPYASLAGFTHGAFDILVRYYISMPERLDAVKQDVNLAIIRTLREINIKLSER